MIEKIEKDNEIEKVTKEILQILIEKKQNKYDNIKPGL